MHAQYRSPARKPVVHDNPPQQQPQAVHRPARADLDRPIESHMAELHFDDEGDEQANNHGQIGASAERSPGRINGRNRDTVMFDPSYKRGTYLPYGGFDQVIDEYYTEGDPSDISIPAPSQLQKREQSRSPQRNMPKSSSHHSIHTVTDSEPHARQNSYPGRPDMPRKVSNTSAHSSKKGSIHGSPNREQFNDPGHETRYADERDALQYGRSERTRPPQSRQTPQYQMRHTNDNVQYDATYTREEGPPYQASYEQQPRYDEGGYSEPLQPQGGRSRPQQRPPQLRPQRSMDFYNPGQPGMRPQNPPGPQQDFRRQQDRDGRERAMYQDPRLAPRPATAGDPRSRPMQNRQQMRPPPNGQHAPEDPRFQRRPNVNDGLQFVGQPNRPQRGGQHQMPVPPLNGKGAPYPSGQSSNYLNDPSTMNRSQGERLRSPPDLRRMPDSGQPLAQFQPGRGPSPGQLPQAQYQTSRGPSPGQMQQGSQYPQGQPHRGNPVREASPQMQRPSTQPAAADQRPQPSNPSGGQRPNPTNSFPPKSEDTSDMMMHAEPVGVITLPELNALRKEVAKTKSPQLQLTLVKRLIEASTVLVAENGTADPKQVKKNKEDYCREALRTLKQITAQEQPYSEAVFFLANCYGNGSLSLDVDHERAFSLYEQAAKMQHPASAYRTAVCLEIGAGTKKDSSRAVRFYERAAEYGDPAAMYKLGMILLRGLLEQQPEKKSAVTWLQKAAEKASIENPHALHELALLYERGDTSAGVVQNEAFAKDLFTKAAKLHYAPSQYRMGYAYEYGTLGCPVDPRRSIAWFSRGAERGDPESELSLSGWYLTGSEGVLAQNDREAYLWGRKAAEKGLAKAEFAVGYFFESGIGTPIDLDEAVKWYKRAATAGQKKAQERLLALSKRKR